MYLFWEKTAVLRWGRIDRREEWSYLVFWVFFAPQSSCFLTLYFNRNHLYCLEIGLYLVLLNLMQRVTANCIVRGELRGPLYLGGTIPSVKFPLIKPWCSSETCCFWYVWCTKNSFGWVWASCCSPAMVTANLSERNLWPMFFSVCPGLQFSLTLARGSLVGNRCLLETGA